MQITEHQSIHIDNLISYNTNIRYSDILKLTHYISDNIKVLLAPFFLFVTLAIT